MIEFDIQTIQVTNWLTEWKIKDNSSNGSISPALTGGLLLRYNWNKLQNLLHTAHLPALLTFHHIPRSLHFKSPPTGGGEGGDQESRRGGAEDDIG